MQDALSLMQPTKDSLPKIGIDLMGSDTSLKTSSKLSLFSFKKKIRSIPLFLPLPM
ncbi:MAG: hypothetical protein LVR00_05890 [Rhabdochlamydiaceae bacterium]|jgi:hypothetical protein